MVQNLHTFRLFGAVQVEEEMFYDDDDGDEMLCYYFKIKYARCTF